MQNTFGKVMEKIVARRLSYDLEVQDKLPEMLGGYCLGRDIVIIALVLAYDIYEGFEREDETVGLRLI